MNWYRALHARGVPMHNGYTLRAVTGDAPALHATAVPVDRDGRVRTDAPPVDVDCDAVCCGFGLMAATDVTRMLGASHAFDPALGGWHVVVDDDQRCNVPGLYAAGDGAGVVGAAAAPWQGRIAAMAAARDAGRLSAGEHEARVRAAKRECVRAARFGGVMTRLANVGDGAVASLAPDVVVCPCEHLTRADDRCRHRRRMRDAGRPPDRDALRRGAVRRKPLRGIGRAAGLAGQRSIANGGGSVPRAAAGTAGRVRHPSRRLAPVRTARIAARRCKESNRAHGPAARAWRQGRPGTWVPSLSRLPRAGPRIFHTAGADFSCAPRPEAAQSVPVAKERT